MMIRRFLAALAVLILAIASPVYAQATLTQQQPAHLDSEAQNTTFATSAGTLTLTPNGGESVYIYSIDVHDCSDATGATAAAVTTITTTNLSGLAFTMGSGSVTAGALGGPGLCQPDLVIAYPTGLKAQTPGTAVTFVLPTFATHQTIRLNVGWRSAPVQ